ncbi:MAG TPA: cell division ATP-binding protein FtsE [Candidatus Polarisedimenticolia bacterium]|nr:cell division ATP-binding protein FtsE [Candidatus Polarisedimenticolia bacterium]
MIQLFHVTRRYGSGAPALSDISFSIEKGDFVFLTGPSGAGKTTLLRLLFRDDLPTSGQVMVNNENLASMPPSRVPYLRRQIGVVFQDFKLLRRKTVFENVSYATQVIGLPAKEQRRRTYQVLEMLALNHRLHHFPEQISGGEQQRVAIARALVNRPLVLLADEPTGNLDPDLSVAILDTFKEVNAQGTTVLVATHDRALIRRMARRVLTLSQGQLIPGGAAA